MSNDDKPTYASPLMLVLVLIFLSVLLVAACNSTMPSNNVGGF